MRKPSYRAMMMDPEEYILANRRTMAWERLERLMLKAKSEMVQLLAAREYLDRIDPKPREAAVIVSAPILIQWAGPPLSSSPSPTPLALSSGSSTNGHGASAQVSWSPTDDSGKP